VLRFKSEEGYAVNFATDQISLFKLILCINKPYTNFALSYWSAELML